MSTRFIKLTKVILNTNDIHKIIIEPNNYCIKFITKSIDGSGWTTGWFGLSRLNTYTYDVNICAEKDPVDYKIVTDWINKLQ